MQLEIELAYYDFAVQYASHFVIPPTLELIYRCS